MILIYLCNRKPEKIIEYQTLVLNERPFGNALAVSFFRRCARLRLCAYDFHCSIQKRRGKLGRNVSFNESHVLYRQHPSKDYTVLVFVRFIHSGGHNAHKADSTVRVRHVLSMFLRNEPPAGMIG